MSYADGIGSLQQPLSPIAATTATTRTQQVPATGSEAKEGGGSVSNVAQADHADLSTAGGLISKALEGSDVRTAKVGALQQAIASGSYHVSSSDVADKMMKSLLG
jgi:negative regulator of flagellin synthesis FlgM